MMEGRYRAVRRGSVIRFTEARVFFNGLRPIEACPLRGAASATDCRRGASPEQSRIEAIQPVGLQTAQEDFPMIRRSIFVGALVAMALGSSSACFAQGAGSDISPEQRTRIKAYMLSERVAPV